MMVLWLVDALTRACNRPPAGAETRSCRRPGRGAGSAMDISRPCVGARLLLVPNHDGKAGIGVGRESSPLPSLIVIRGNSGSGKSSTALAVRKAAGRGVALVQQDVIRRDLLRERDRPQGLNIELIALNVRFCLAHDYDVILEGILSAARYGDMIRGLIDEHRGPSFVYYYDIPFEETLRRHAAKPNCHEFGEREMAEWFVERDLLGVPSEQIIGQDLTQQETIARILAEALPPRVRPGSDAQSAQPASTVPEPIRR